MCPDRTLDAFEFYTGGLEITFILNIQSVV